MSNALHQLPCAVQSDEEGHQFVGLYSEEDRMSAEDAVRRLYGPGVNSDDRLFEMLCLLTFEPPPVFWNVFLNTWSSCDATWRDRRLIVSTLRRHNAEDPFTRYLSADDRRRFDTLPDRVVVYRGGDRSRLRGPSWTMSRTVAEGFARGHRGIRYPEPAIAQAHVPKSALLAMIWDREEEELLVDLRGIRFDRIECLNEGSTEVAR